MILIYVLTICFPTERIIEDVFPQAVQFDFIPDDPVIVISLPEALPWRVQILIDGFGRMIFKVSNDLSEAFLFR